MKKIAGILLVVFFGFIFSQIAAAQEASTGAISGEVVSGTEGSVVGAGEQVSMLIYEDGLLIKTELTETDTEGKFLFTDISTDPGYQYMFHIHYSGVDYYAGEWVVFSEGETDKSTSINVCASTTSDEAVKIIHAHTIISFYEDGLEISESFLFSNQGDRTCVGHEGHATSEGTGVLIFTFPLEAQVSADFFENFILLDDVTFADPLPFPPGERQLDYSYRLPVPDPRDCVVSLQFNYPADTLRIMVRDDDVEVAGDQLVEVEKISSQTGEQFIQLMAENLADGTALKISISPAPGKFDWVALILWILAGLLVVAFILFMIKLGKRRANGGMARDDKESVQSVEQRLLHEIAKLDDDFEQGAIDEASYRQMRSEKKAQLLALKHRGK